MPMSLSREEIRRFYKEQDMKKDAGLWIDHRKTVIVIVTDDGDKTVEIDSHVEKQPGRIEGIRSTAPFEAQQVPADDSHQREFTGRLNRYYTEVIAALSDVGSILIFGPGEAKDELNKRLDLAGRGGRITAIETADKMTDHQIAAKVREYFHKANPSRPPGYLAVSQEAAQSTKRNN